MIRAACLEAQLLSQIKGRWELYDYSPDIGRIESQPPCTLQGKLIRNHLRVANKVVVLSVTIGKPIENTITAYFKEGRYSYSLLLDAAATTAVEMAIDEMEKTIQYLLQSKGYQTITRLSPGYGDWDIRFQANMLDLAHAQEIGISLTESCMLMPRKSVTALIGVIPHLLNSSKKAVNCCTNCNQTDCLARKEIHS